MNVIVPPVAHGSRLALVVPLLLILAVYLSLSLAIAHTKVPWCDEGWFANPAYNLAMRGNMGTNVLEPSGHYLNAYLSGIQQRTYVVVPLHLVTLAGWFKLFGFSAVSMRAYSILWGAIALAAIFLIVWKLTRNRILALLSIALTSVDFLFLWGAADGRMDMMCSSLGFCSLAAYLLLRTRGITLAIIASQSLAAAACFTHPNGTLAIVALVWLAFSLDREKIGKRHLLFAAAPYLLFALAWLPYILQSPADFRAQFFANAGGRNAARWKMIVQPWMAIWYEISKYFTSYGVYPIWTGQVNRILVLVPFAYFGALSWCGLHQRNQPEPGNRALFQLTIVYLLTMTFLIGFKAQNYLPYVIPLHCIILALWIEHSWRSGRAAKLSATFVTAALLLIQGSALYQKIRLDEYDRQYQLTASDLRTYSAQGKTILASASFGFALGFDAFKDDARLGKYSARLGDIVVLDPSYRQWYKHFETEEPEVSRYVTGLLRREYHTIQRNDLFEILERNPSR